MPPVIITGECFWSALYTAMMRLMKSWNGGIKRDPYILKSLTKSSGSFTGLPGKGAPNLKLNPKHLRLLVFSAVGKDILFNFFDKPLQYITRANFSEMGDSAGDHVLDRL